MRLRLETETKALLKVSGGFIQNELSCHENSGVEFSFIFHMLQL